MLRGGHDEGHRACHVGRGFARRSVRRRPHGAAGSPTVPGRRARRVAAPNARRPDAGATRRRSGRRGRWTVVASTPDGDAPAEALRGAGGGDAAVTPEVRRPPDASVERTRTTGAHHASTRHVGRCGLTRCVDGVVCAVQRRVIDEVHTTPCIRSGTRVPLVQRPRCLQRPRNHHPQCTTSPPQTSPRWGSTPAPPSVGIVAPSRRGSTSSPPSRRSRRPALAARHARS